jgi:hypothetical protein
MDHIEAAQKAVIQRYGPAYKEIAGCAAVHARTATVRELEEYYRDQFAAYAERLQVAISLLREEHRHSRAAGEGLLDSLLDSLNKEATP